MRKLIIIAVLAVVVAACSSDGSDATTTTTTGGGGSGTTTTAPAPGSTAPASTTTTSKPPAAPAGLAECVIGTWELDSQHFFDQIAAEMDEEDGEFTYLGGAYQITAQPDGTFIDKRIDWQFGVSTDFGDMELTINHTQMGTYTVDDGTMSTTIPGGQGPPDVALTLDGEPFEIPGGITPFESPDASFDTATPDCGDDTMTVSFDGYTSIWTRVG
ncbi:MAG: hypothetical protein R2823_00495 [Acidimicrobiia bacterium]